MSCSCRYLNHLPAEAQKTLTDKSESEQSSPSRNPASLPALLLVLPALIAVSCPLVLAEESSTPAAPSQHVSKKHKKSASVNGLGLDPISLKMVNHGRFKDLIERLKTRDLKNSTRTAAWLAFAYMYLNHCDDLDALAKSFVGANNDDPNTNLIEIFNLICHKKLEEAEKKLQSIPASAMNDPFVNFAFAAAAGKQGKAAVAVTYTQRATSLAPNFAWGFRTIGFLQQRLLNAPAEAELAYAKAVALEPDMTDAVNTLVDLRLVRNDFDGAIEVARAAIEKAPRDASNYFRLAQIYIQQWRLKEAAAQLQRAIALEPDNAKYYRTRASIDRYQGNLDLAIADLRKAVDLSADKKFELAELASLEVAAGKDDDATQHLLEAVALDPSNQRANGQLVALLNRRGKYDQLVTVVKGLVAKEPKNAVLRMYLADALVALNKPDEAVEHYKEAANLNQSDPEPHRKLAAIAVNQKKFSVAQKEYTRALNINPNSTPDLVALGFCYAQTDDYLQAEAGFVTALALHQLTQPPDSTIPPTRLDIMRSLATLLFKEGRYADAASQFATVCSMGKSLPTAALDNFMLAQAGALRDRSSASFKTLKEAFDSLSDTDRAQQRINYIDTLLRGGRYDDALAQLKIEDENTAAAKDVRPLVLVCWSRAWRGKNEIAKAEEAAKKAAEMSSKSGEPLSDALDELAEVYLLKGDLEAAAQNAQRAIGINEKAFRAYALLARISLKKGQANAALTEATKALEINPYYAEGYLIGGDAQLALNDLKNASSNYQKAVNLYPGLLQTHEALANVLNKMSLKDEAKKEEDTIVQLKSQQ